VDSEIRNPKSEMPPLIREEGLFHRFAKGLVKGLYRTLWGCVWRGASRVPADEPFLLIANHPSYLDPLCLYVGAPRRVFFMAWEQLFKVPWMGPFIRKNGVFPVTNIHTDTRAFRTAARLLKDGKPVGIFPEGGRSAPTGEMLPFLAGPFRLASLLRVPVLPVTVNASWRVWPRGPLLPRLGGHIEILFHPPLRLHPRARGRKPDTAQEAEDLARKTRDVILGAYRAPPDVLERSRRTPVLPPGQHPLIQADRHGVPPLDWLRRWTICP